MTLIRLYLLCYVPATGLKKKANYDCVFLEIPEIHKKT